MRRLLPIALCLFACSRPLPPPYGFGTAPEQRYHFETDETTDVDGTPVEIVRSADVVLRARPSENAATDLELFIERYHTRIAGAPGGTTEMSLSEEGLSATTNEGPVHLGADEPTPGGGSVREIRARPAASAELDARGAATRPLWTSPEPVLQGISLLDWMLLALPTRGPAGASHWLASRQVPQVGQYALGIELPVRWEERDGPLALRSASTVRRDSVRLAQEFEGSLSISTRGEAELEPDGRVRDARLVLSLDFAATNGTHVASRHSIRLRCAGCGGEDVNPPRPPSDTDRGRDGIPQQGHVDDLPDHGGVRRGI